MRNLEVAKEYVITNIDFEVAKDYVPYAVEFNTDDLLTASLPGINTNKNTSEHGYLHMIKKQHKH